MKIRYKPKTDKLFWWMLVIVNAICLPMLALGFFNTVSLVFAVLLLLFVNYFLLSPLFGYAELREEDLYIKYGLFIHKTIPYKNIRTAEIKRSVISEAVLNLKLSLEHTLIKYNKFDFTIVSVTDNRAFAEELMKKQNNKMTTLPE